MRECVYSDTSKQMAKEEYDLSGDLDEVEPISSSSEKR